MSLKGQDVTILGGGIAGLAAARAFAQQGAKVTVLEQTEALREVGAGLQITPNGASVMRALGLGEALDRISRRSEAVELCDGYSGRVVTRLDVAKLRPDQGWHLTHRADLIAVLAEGAREAGVEIRLLQKVDHVDLSGARPVLHMATGAREEAGLLIGADGLHSPLRSALNGKVDPFFTRQIAWRALIPCEADAPAVAEVHMGAGRHLVSYPLRGGKLRNIVAVEERRRWVEEGWSLRDDPLELRLAFEEFGPRVQGWLEQVEDVWLWGLFRHPVAKLWQKVLPEGAVALAGDAAHPTLPFLAQGANMALEDIWALSQCLSQESDRNLALRRYQALRARRSAAIVEAANRNAKAYHLSGPIRPLAHMVLRMGGILAPGLALKRYDWIHGYDVTKEV